MKESYPVLVRSSGVSENETNEIERKRRSETYVVRLLRVMDAVRNEELTKNEYQDLLLAKNGDLKEGVKFLSREKGSFTGMLRWRFSREWRNECRQI